MKKQREGVSRIGGACMMATLAICLLLAGSGPAHAYLDPGAGSMLLQVLLGGVAGILVIGKLYWHRLLVLVGLRREEQSEVHPGDKTPG
jgi:hypothetical protein